MKFLYEEDLNDQGAISPQESEELMRVTIDHNTKVAAKQKEIQQLDNQLIQAKNTIRKKYAAMAQAKASKTTTAKPVEQQKPTGNVTTSGQPVNSQGNPVAPTVESYPDILHIREINERRDVMDPEDSIVGILINVDGQIAQVIADDGKYLTIKFSDGSKDEIRKTDAKPKAKQYESTYNTSRQDPEELQSLKDYLDAENISYAEDEGGTIDFDDSELNSEWVDQLADMKEEPETDDILSVEDDDDKDIKDIDSKIDEEKVFYVKVDHEGEEFIGKIYKLFNDGDWRSKLVDGESETFEELNYDPEWDEFDIIAFLRENYADAELIDEAEFNNHAEEPVDEPKKTNENMNEAYASKFREGQVIINGKSFNITKVENINNKMDAISLGNGKTVSSTWLESQGAEMVKPERKGRASQEKRMTKREYEKLLKGAMKDVREDKGDDDHSTVYDMADSMLYDEDLLDYLQRRHEKEYGDSPFRRPKRHNFLDELVNDLAIYAESKEIEFKNELNEKRYAIPTLEEFLLNENK